MASHLQPQTIRLSTPLFLTSFLLGLLSFISLVSYAQDKAELKKLIRVESQPFMAEFYHFKHGYYVYRGTIQNVDKQAHKIDFQQNDSILKTFELKAGETTNISLPIPVTKTDFGYPISVMVDSHDAEKIALNADNHLLTNDNRQQHKRIRFGSFSIPNPDATPIVYSEIYSCLVCRSMRKDFSGSDLRIEALQDCKFWPQDRLDYSCLDAIFLTPNELADAPQGVQTALRQFIQAGGELYLFDCKNQHESLEKIAWITQIQKDSNPESIYPSASKNKLTLDDNQATPQKVVRYTQVFGNLVLIDFSIAEFQHVLLQDCSDEQLLEETLQTIKHTPKTYSDVWFSIHNVNTWQKRFPIVENTGIPRLEISIVIIVFVLLVGPINIIVLARLNKRIWLLVTVPALSFLFAGTILVYTIFHEGFQTEVCISSVTCLDQRDGSYTSLSQLGVYARTTAQNVTFDSCDELNCVTELPDVENSCLSVNWTTGKQQLDSSFAPVKTPTYYRIRKTNTTDRKLDFDFKASAPFVVNGLGTDIKSLFVCDEKGSLWTATDIHAGEKVSLKLMSQNKSEKVQDSAVSDKLSIQISNLISSLNWGMVSLPFELVNTHAHSQNALPTKTYIVTFDSPGPFANKGISYAKQKDCFSFILGKF